MPRGETFGSTPRMTVPSLTTRKEALVSARSPFIETKQVRGLESVGLEMDLNGCWNANKNFHSKIVLFSQSTIELRAKGKMMRPRLRVSELFVAWSVFKTGRNVGNQPF